MTISLKHRFCTIALLALTISLSGCASRLEKPRLPDVFKDPPPAGKTNGTYTLDLFNADFGDYTKAIKNPVPTEIDLKTATALRNKMVYGVMAEIDYVYQNYEISLFMNEGSFKVATDVLQLGLGMASTITNGARAKTVLSAALTGFTGATLSIDKNFFRQQTVQALISSMQAGRDQTKNLILQRLSEPDTTYPFQAARSDMTAYFFAGTLPGALQHLNQTAAAKADDEHVALNQTQLALSGISTADVKIVTNIRDAIDAALKSGTASDLKKVIDYVNAMAVVPQVHADATTDVVRAAEKAVGKAVVRNSALLPKQELAARNAGLIP